MEFRQSGPGSDGLCGIVVVRPGSLQLEGILKESDCSNRVVWLSGEEEGEDDPQG